MTFQIARVFGIPIRLHWSWLGLMAWVTFALASTVFPEFLEDRSTLFYTGLALATAALFFACVIAHELAHSVVALSYRIPVRSITLFMFGGAAQITREPKRALNELLMAGAGPATSMVIGLALLVPFVFFDARDSTALGAVVLWLALINIALAIFNMLPAFPMDGGRVFRALLWMITRNFTRASTIAAWTGIAFGAALIGIGVCALAGVDMYISRGPSGIFQVLIGWFLIGQARAQLVQAQAMHLLEGFRASDVMISDLPTIDGSRSVASVARNVIDLNPRLCYYVEEDGKLAGLLGAPQIHAIPLANWETTPVSAAMVGSKKLEAVDPATPITDVIMDMENAGLSHAPVVSEGRVLGVIARDRIIDRLRAAGLFKNVA